MEIIYKDKKINLHLKVETLDDARALLAILKKDATGQDRLSEPECHCWKAFSVQQTELIRYIPQRDRAKIIGKLTTFLCKHGDKI
jgi:hypothetical protein